MAATGRSRENSRGLRGVVRGAWRLCSMGQSGQLGEQGVGAGSGQGRSHLLSAAALHRQVNTTGS